MSERNNLEIHANIQTKTANCEKHGDYVSRCYFAKIWTGCPVCINDEESKRKAEKEEEAKRERLAAWQKKIGQSGIPERFHSRSLENFQATTDDQRAALEFARQYADGFQGVLESGRCALFIGGPGTGKTHLACAIGLHVMREHRRTVLFSTVMRAIRRIKDTWAKGAAESESQAVASLVEPDLLILDEIGVQVGSEFERNMLFDIINDRYENRKPTILMSNLPGEEVIKHLGERVVDRIREDGGQIVRFSWASHRGAK
jgi:DNA replication protein DnaC